MSPYLADFRVLGEADAAFGLEVMILRFGTTICCPVFAGTCFRNSAAWKKLA
jgi:hypothetical protein